MPATPTVPAALSVWCLTCAHSPADGTGMVVHGDSFTEHGHTDTAHMPHWVIDLPGWELADVADLHPGDQLATGETVREVIHVTADIWDWPDREDGQTTVRTDVRTVKVGWPGGSRIVRAVPYARNTLPHRKDTQQS